MTVPRLTPSAAAVSSLRELQEVAAGDREAALLGEPVHGVEQAGPGLAAEQSRLGGRDRVPRAVCSGHAQREGIAPAGRTSAVARLVRDDAQQPGPKRSAAAEAAERAIGLDAAVLRRSSSAWARLTR